jgi:nitroreductase
MDFQGVLRRRRMVRQFTADPVPQHSLDRILANAVRGPSAGFCQGQAFLVLTGDDLPRFWAYAGEATRLSVHAAPLIIVPLSCKRIYIDEYVQRDPSWADESRIRAPTTVAQASSSISRRRVCSQLSLGSGRPADRSQIVPSGLITRYRRRRSRRRPRRRAGSRPGDRAADATTRATAARRTTRPPQLTAAVPCRRSAAGLRGPARAAILTNRGYTGRQLWNRQGNGFDLANLANTGAGARRHPARSELPAFSRQGICG